MNKSVLLGGMLLFLLVACGGAQPARPEAELVTSAEDIEGNWDTAFSVVHFGEDGSFVYAPSMTLINHPTRAPDEYWFDGDDLHVRGTDDPFCDDTEGVYQVVRLDGDKIGFVAINEPCDLRASVLQGEIDDETGNPKTYSRVE